MAFYSENKRAERHSNIHNIKIEKFIYYLFNITIMTQEERLRILEGLHTVETIAEKLHLTRESTINLLSTWRKQGHVTVWAGGGKSKRIYKITARKQRPRDPGMWDIINKYSPHMKLSPWYDHQVHGPYGPEEALIDAIETKSFRVLLAGLHLFKHIKDWKKVYHLAKKRDAWQKVGALYEVARIFFRVRKMPLRYRQQTFKKQHYLIRDYETKEPMFQPITKKWKVKIPFRRGDFDEAVLG